MSACTFCDMGKIVHEIFYEDSNFLGIYNIKPVFPGHSLLIPRRHIESLTQLSPEEAGGLLAVLQKVMTALKAVYAADGFNVVVQEGASAGGTIEHLHIHLLPRKSGDVPAGEEWFAHFRHMEHSRKTIPKTQILANIEKIRAALQ